MTTNAKRTRRAGSAARVLRALALLAAVSGHAAALPPQSDGSLGGPPVALSVHPGRIRLDSGADRQSVVVQARRADGVTLDVTDAAHLTLADPSLAHLEGATVLPLADGTTELRARLGGLACAVPVVVEGADVDPPTSFRLDVVPAITKAGCNNGVCHGAASGKDGFRLSLFGFDPAGDYDRITREQPGRRVNLAVPRESLILQKGLGRVSHTGGQRFTEDDELYETILSWIAAGVPDDPDGVARPTGIELFPQGLVLEGRGTTHRLCVRAVYSDGTDRDVTRLAAFISNDTQAAEVGPEGVVTAGARGEAFVMARFGEFTVGTQVIVLPEGLEWSWPDVPENNYVDRLVHAKLKKLRIVPSELCSGEAFLRRVTLDVTGTLPTPAERSAFLADDDPQKRAKLVDRLLGRKEFVELWVMRFAELLQIRSAANVNLGLSYKATVLYHDWLEERLASGVPVDRIVRELLASEGGTFANPATNFYQNERDTKKLAENVAQAFLGMRIQCAQCHNHPFDRWTMDDYYGFVSFFAQVGRKRAEDPRETIVFNRRRGEVRHPVGGRAVKPRFLGGPEPDVGRRDRRGVLAEWLTAPGNPWFARNFANIVWAHFMGRGIVEPVDDLRVSNPASNPELLAELGRRLTEYGYAFEKLVRDICTSRTYQLSTRPNGTNAHDERNFSRALLRRLRAEVLFDVISQVTETAGSNKFRGLPEGARAVQIVDGRVSNYFLTTFGRATRETVCSCEVEMEPNLSQALHLINGRTVHQKIRGGRVVKRLLDDGRAADEVVRALWVRCLGREPTDAEMEGLRPHLGTGKDARASLEDVFWALLNSKEFMFNH